MNILTLQICISFIVGGLMISMQSLIAERVPLQWRGVVLTVPTTMAIGLFFIGLTKTVQDVPEAVTIIPAALGIDYIWVLTFTFLSQFSLLAAFFGAFGVWTLLATLLLKFPPESFASSTAVGMGLILLAYFFVRKMPQVTGLTPVPMTWKHIFVRSLIGGSVVATIVILSKTLGNIWGGLFSTFPAAFLASLLIYYFVHGQKVIPSVAKSFFFPGAFGFIIYPWVAAWAFPLYGIWIGTLCSYLVVIPFYIFYTTRSSKMRSS